MKNILEELTNLKQHFEDIKSGTTNKQTTFIINEAINGIDIVLEENADVPHKNIGIKINKFNYQKYVHCKNGLDKITKNMEKINVETFNLNNEIHNQIKYYTLKYEAIKESILNLQSDIAHKINTYEKGKKANKKVA